MPLPVKLISTLLSEKRLEMPILESLNPATGDYDLLLFQPRGEIHTANESPWIGQKDRARAISQGLQFLRQASAENAHLVVAPEYSIPWASVQASFEASEIPRAGALWVLGMEPLSPTELEAWKVWLQAVRPDARVLDPGWDVSDPANREYLDPLLYVFRARSDVGEEHLVVAIQYKTFPSADQTEQHQLILGNTLLVFDGAINLFTLICSDVLNDAVYEVFDAHADPALILHLQLNPKPRDHAYIAYRARLFEQVDDRLEILTLNWAERVADLSGAKPEHWKNIGGTALYSHHTEADLSEERIAENHKLGFYFCRGIKGKQISSYHVNFHPGVYSARTSKVVRKGGKKASRMRRGLLGRGYYQWNPEEQVWVAASPCEDGFLPMLAELTTDPVKVQLHRLYEINPILIERVAALTLDESNVCDDWYNASELVHFELSDNELINRLSFAQDFDPKAAKMRKRRISDIQALGSRLTKLSKWPAPLHALSGNFEFTWTAQCPAVNLHNNDTNQSALVVYIGEDPGRDDIVGAFKKARDLMNRYNPVVPAVIFYSRGGVTEDYYNREDETFTSIAPNPVDLTNGAGDDVETLK